MQDISEQNSIEKKEIINTQESDNNTLLQDQLQDVVIDQQKQTNKIINNNDKNQQEILKQTEQDTQNVNNQNNNQDNQEQNQKEKYNQNNENNNNENEEEIKFENSNFQENEQYSMNQQYLLQQYEQQQGLSLQQQQEQYQEQQQQLQYDNIHPQVYIIDPLVDIEKGIVQFCAKGVDVQGAFEIFRQLKDFFLLRTILNEMWPGFYLPPIPNKDFSNTDVDIIEERRSMLDLFMQKLSQINSIWYSEEVRNFLDASIVNLEKTFNKPDKKQYSQIIQRYQNSFSELTGLEINLEVILKITKFYEFLKNMQNSMKNYSVIVQNMIQKRKLNFECQLAFTHIILPEYEKNILKQQQQIHENSQLFLLFSELETLNPNFGYQRKHQEIPFSYELILNMLKYEEKELQAFMETIQTKDYYEALKNKCEKKHLALTLELQGLMIGKTNKMKDLFQGKNIQQKITEVQKEIQDTKDELQTLQLICDMIVVILGHIEIDNFKKQKKQKYYSLLGTMADLEFQAANREIQFWETVLKNVPKSSEF